MNKNIFLLCLLFSGIAFGNTVVLVTGASRGIGLNIVEALASDAQHDYVVCAGVRTTSNKNAIFSLKTEYPRQIHIVTIKEAEDLFAVNFFGVMRVSQEVLHPRTPFRCSMGFEFSENLTWKPSVLRNITA